MDRANGLELGQAPAALIRAPGRREHEREQEAISCLCERRLARPAPATLYNPSSMFSRLVASLLALVLLWSCLTAQELDPLSASANVEQADAALAVSPYAGTDGSVGDHHLDDQPAQTHGEHHADSPGLLQGGPAVLATALLMFRRVPLSVAMRHPPYLDAPQRPPCEIRRHA
jgi:hypothetical protein